MEKKVKNTKICKKSLVIGWIIGLFTGAFLSSLILGKSMAGVEDDMQVAENLQQAISLIEDDDMPILIKSMNPEKIAETNNLLGGDANVQAFIATYCTVDPDFSHIIIDYAIGIE